MTRARAAAALALVAFAAGGLAAARAGAGGRLRHLAVPVLGLASLPAAPGKPLVPGRSRGCEVEEVAHVARRPTALLPVTGALWVGTFDDGVVRVGDGAGAPALAGRRRFVNALASHAGTVWAATQGGLVALEGPDRGRVLLGGEGVTALAVARGTLYAGTAHGLFRVSAERGAEPAAVVTPGVESLRVTALAASPADGETPGAGRLWIGTASGAWSLPLGALAAGGAAPLASWSPLVFGHPAAGTNVVTALAALPGGGAVAGTDDGGLVRLGGGDDVSAAPLAEPRANEVNPGAAAAFAGGAALGTQGGGLLLARADGTSLAVEHPAALAAGEVSAVWAGAGRLLAGTADGRVLGISCRASP